MSTYDIRPAPDGHNMQQNWEVKGPRQTTSHITKHAALNEADRRANEGDTKIIRGTGGEIQRRQTHRGGSESDIEAGEMGGFGFDIPMSPGNHGEGVLDVQDSFFK